MTKLVIRPYSDQGYYGRVARNIGTETHPAQCIRYVTDRATLARSVTTIKTIEQTRMLLNQAPETFNPPHEEIVAVREFEAMMSRRRETFKA